MSKEFLDRLVNALTQFLMKTRFAFSSSFYRIFIQMKYQFHRIISYLYNKSIALYIYAYYNIALKI
jgi:hypothetical protein